MSVASAAAVRRPRAQHASAVAPPAQHARKRNGRRPARCVHRQGRAVPDQLCERDTSARRRGRGEPREPAAPRSPPAQTAVATPPTGSGAGGDVAEAPGVAPEPARRIARKPSRVATSEDVRDGLEVAGIPAETSPRSDAHYISGTNVARMATVEEQEGSRACNYARRWSELEACRHRGRLPGLSCRPAFRWIPRSAVRARN